MGKKETADCPFCKERMTTSMQQGILNHFYCVGCKKVYLPNEVVIEVHE